MDAVEGQIDALIRTRSPDEEQRVIEELWMESTRKAKERQREENRLAWGEFHRGMSDVHRRLAAEHEERALRLLEGEAHG